jgi:hypothetical protein
MTPTVFDGDRHTAVEPSGLGLHVTSPFCFNGPFNGSLRHGVPSSR